MSYDLLAFAAKSALAKIILFSLVVVLAVLESQGAVSKGEAVVASILGLFIYLSFFWQWVKELKEE